MATQDFDADSWLAETFARNQALYAGWRMELEDESNEDEETPVEGDDAPEGDENEGGDEEQPDDIPAEVLRANLTKANQEAANYRRRLREVEKALEGRKTEDEVNDLIESLKTERESVERTLLVENVALKHSLPEELASVLKGNSREELEAHAKVLAKFAPSNGGAPGDLDGGLNPGNDDSDDGLDPRERVRKIKGYR